MSLMFKQKRKASAPSLALSAPSRAKSAVELLALAQRAAEQSAGAEGNADSDDEQEESSEEIVMRDDACSSPARPLKPLPVAPQSDSDEEGHGTATAAE